MTKYVLVESRDPFESRSFAARCELAAQLQASGAAVMLMLVENGVLGARARAAPRELERTARAGVRVAADGFALRERGIEVSELPTYVEASSLDALLEPIGAGACVLWS